MEETLLNHCSRPEFVGCTLLDTIGLFLPSVDGALRKAAAVPEEIKSVGIISSRTGAAGQILACDDAAKKTGVVPVSIELPRDTKGWGGHGCFLLLGGKTPSETREAVELALEGIKKNAGEVHISEAGHLEFAFGAGAGSVLHHAFGVPLGASFGFCAASPAAIGFVLADGILKEHSVSLLQYLSPDHGTRHSNEVVTVFTGETSDVKSAVIDAKERGMSLLRAMGSEPKSPAEPYLL